jgi:hypothetical protein
MPLPAARLPMRRVPVASVAGFQKSCKKRTVVIRQGASQVVRMPPAASRAHAFHQEQTGLPIRFRISGPSSTRNHGPVSAGSRRLKTLPNQIAMTSRRPEVFLATTARLLYASSMDGSA